MPLLEHDGLDHRDRAVGGAAFGRGVDVVEEGRDFGPVDEAVGTAGWARSVPSFLRRQESIRRASAADGRAPVSPAPGAAP